MPNEQFYCFQNSLGGLDTVRCTGEAKYAPEYTPSTALMNEVEDVYYIEKKDVTTQNTGWLNKAITAWLHDFFTAKQRYKYEDNTPQAVVIDEVTAETSTTEDLIAFEFTYREAKASIYLNLKRDGITTSCTWVDYANVLEYIPPTFTCTWGDYVNVLEYIQPTFACAWGNYVNVLKKSCRNAYSHAYSRAYNCTSPETPFLKVSPDSVWLPQVDPRAEIEIESNTNWFIE
jgi:hypothetical protein